MDFESSCLLNNSEFKWGIGSRMVDFKPIKDDEGNEIGINICFDSGTNIISKSHCFSNTISTESFSLDK